MTVARLASVVGGNITPRMINKDDDLVNTTMVLGTGICIFSLICGVFLVIIDRYAEKKDGTKAELSADDKF